MSRVVPSQVVSVVDKLFPGAKTQTEGGQALILYSGNAPQLAAIIDLVERVPDELVVLDAEDFATLRVCISAIRTQISQWNASSNQPLVLIGGLPPLSPVRLIRDVMVKCPDEGPAPGTAELIFLQHPELRESIRLDISAATRDLAQGEWKGATVLAGSALEALLLWALQEYGGRNPGAVAGAPETWGLQQLIPVAAELKLITADTATQAMLAKNFRNLIHPGRTTRLGQRCDRATALTALAAVEAVARDLAA